jgi:hypothetical protein
MVSDIEVLRLKLELVTAERDRLRAVVDAAAGEASEIAHETAGRLMADRARNLARWLRLSLADLNAVFDQLDVSPAIGGEMAPPVHGQGDRSTPHTSNRGVQGNDSSGRVAGGADPTSPTYDPDEYGTFTQADGATNSPLGGEAT